MKSAIPVQSVLELNEGSYSRETSALLQGNGRFYATTNLRAGSTAMAHYHDDTHLTFLVKGRVRDKRKGRSDDRVSGQLMFFYAGEVHQSFYETFPAVNITLEIAPSYLNQH